VGQRFPIVPNNAIGVSITGDGERRFAQPVPDESADLFQFAGFAISGSVFTANDQVNIRPTAGWASPTF